jgi:hypothetical protein
MFQLLFPLKNLLNLKKRTIRDQRMQGEDPIETQLISKATELESSVGGNNVLSEICSLFETLKLEIRERTKAKKAEMYEEFFYHLNKLLYTEAIQWEDVKDKTWENEEQRNNNRFPFLQGDLIISQFPRTISKYSNETDHWIVLERTCGATRSTFIRVAPAIPIYAEYQHSNKQLEKDRWNKLCLSIKLKGSRFYFYPPYVNKKQEKQPLGYLCELEAPFHLERMHAESTRPVRSMNYPGWLIFKSFLQATEQVLDLKEEKT